MWDDDHIRSLLVSISLSYPIGAVMTLVAGNPDVNFKARLLEGVTLGASDLPDRVTKWRRFQDAIINSFVQYHVPTIDLAKSTPKEAVCQVFEKVNTGGVTLTVFELLTATYAAGDFELRKDWDARHERLAQHVLLARVDATAFLQVVTLLATYDRRRAHLQAHPEDDKAPAVSCKRREVLRLPLGDYRQWADVAERGLRRAVPFLHSHRIFRYRDLPYATQLVPLGAIFGWLEDRAESYASRQRLGQWFWCGVLGEMYGGAAETRFANDVEDCIAWIEDGADSAPPRTVQAAQFQAERLLTLRTRNSAAYKGLYALQMKQGGRDFKTVCAVGNGSPSGFGGSKAGLESALHRCDYRFEDVFHLLVETCRQFLAVTSVHRVGTEADDDVEATQLEQALRVSKERSVAPPADRQVGRRLPRGRAVVECSRVDLHAVARRIVEQRGTKAVDLEALRARSLGEDHHAVTAAQHVLDKLVYAQHVTRQLSIYEDGSYRAAQHADQRPRPDLHLGDEPRVGAGRQNRNIDIAEVVADEQKGRPRGGPLHAEAAPDDAQAQTRPDAEDNVARRSPQARRRQEQGEDRPQDGEEDTGDQRQQRDAQATAQKARERRRRDPAQSAPHEKRVATMAM